MFNKVIFVCCIWTGFSHPSNLQNIDRGSRKYVHSESNFINLSPTSFGDQPNSISDIEGNPGPVTPFNFSIEVSDSSSGNVYSHKAKMLEGDKKGEYRVGLPDGRTQIVNYFIDASGGYNAKVSYEGEIKPYVPANQNSIREAIKQKRKVNPPFSEILDEVQWAPVQNTKKISRQTHSQLSDSLQTENNTSSASYFPSSQYKESPKSLSNEVSEKPFKVGQTYITPPISNQAAIPEVGKVQTYIPPTNNSQSAINNHLIFPGLGKVNQTFIPPFINSQATVPDSANVGQTYITPNISNQAVSPELEKIVQNAAQDAKKVAQTYIKPTIDSQAVIPDASKLGQTYIQPTISSHLANPEAGKVGQNLITPTIPDPVKIEQTYKQPTASNQPSFQSVGKVVQNFLPSNTNSQATIPDKVQISQNYVPPTIGNQLANPNHGKVEQNTAQDTGKSTQTNIISTISSQATLTDADKLAQTYIPPIVSNQVTNQEVGIVGQNAIPPTISHSVKVEPTNIPPAINKQSLFQGVEKVSLNSLPSKANSQVTQYNIPPTNAGQSTFPGSEKTGQVSISTNSGKELDKTNIENLRPDYFSEREARQSYQPPTSEETDENDEYRSGFGTPKPESIISQPNDAQDYNKSQYIVPRSNYNSPSSSYG